MINSIEPFIIHINVHFIYFLTSQVQASLSLDIYFYIQSAGKRPLLTAPGDIPVVRLNALLKEAAEL